MLGQFVREAMNDVQIENGFLNFAAKTVLPEAVDVVEIAVVSTGTFFGWTAAVNHAADKKIEKEKAEAAKKAEEPEVEVVDNKTGKAAK